MREAQHFSRQTYSSGTWASGGDWSMNLGFYLYRGFGEFVQGFCASSLGGSSSSLR